MVYSDVQLLRERGVNATGVRDVVEHAHAPRGSFQHYFPEGKDQLVAEAVMWSGDYAAGWARKYRGSARNATPSGLFRHMVRQWQDEFTARGFRRGCPVMATAADVVGADSALTEQLRAAIDRWHAAVTEELVAMHVDRRRARRLATLMLSALEGAIMLARVQRDTAPLTTVVSELGPVLDDWGPRRR
jgi:AcrR family transcriptional regulator